MKNQDKFLILGPPSFLEGVPESISAEGESAPECVYCRELVDLAGKAAAGAFNGLVICEQPGLSGAARSVANILSRQKDMKALLLLTPESVGEAKKHFQNVDGQRAVFREVGENPQDAIEETRKYLLARRKAGMSELPASEIQIEYGKEGITLLIDPARFRRLAPQGEKLNDQEQAVLNSQLESIYAHLKKLKVRDANDDAIRFVLSHNVDRPVKIAPPQARVRDAEFSLDLIEDKLHLHFTPPTKGGAPLDKMQILKAAREKLEKRPWLYHEAALDKAAEKLEGGASSLLLAERKDGSFAIEITPDRQTAYMTLQKAWDGHKPLPEDVLAKLAALNVTYGIKEEALRAAFKHEVYGERVAVAQGRPPIQGENGWFEILWDKKKDEEAKRFEQAEGNVDFREASKMLSVEKGELIANIHPPKQGKPGIDIYGAEAPAADGAPVLALPYSFALKDIDDNALFYGEGVAMTRDMNGLLATQGGAPQFADGVVSVFPLCEIPGDVDFSVGNIDFNGNVVVHGNVLSRFQVKAGGNIVVHGTVEDAILDAGVDIILHRGVTGSERAIIFARRDVIAKNIHTANVFALGKIQVEESVYHSRLISCKDISIGGDSDLGQIVGGAAKAAKSIDAAEVGGINHTHTRVEVGKNPMIREEMDALRSAFANSRYVASKAQDLYKLAAKKSKELEGKNSPSDEKETKLELTDEAAFHEVFIEWIDDFQSSDLDLLTPPQLEDRDRFLRIVGRVKIYPGVTAMIRSDMIPVRNMLTSCCLTPNGMTSYDKAVVHSHKKRKKQEEEDGADIKITKLGYKKGGKVGIEEQKS